jgi:hypothetical protein
MSAVPVLNLVLAFMIDGSPTASNSHVTVQQFVNRHCTDCHNRNDRAAGLAIDVAIERPIVQDPQTWERVVRKLQSRQMPPLSRDRPDERDYVAVLDSLTGSLDRVAAERPDPGRAGTFRRLTRTEYQNAVRDLLAINIDAATLLPDDPASHGFDNVTVADLSPTQVERYIAAAQTISRIAVGGPRPTPGGDVFRVRADRTQEQHIAGLPIGTRGGVLIPYTFPMAGEYDIEVRLARDRNEHVEGLNEPHELEILLDRERAGLFTVRPARERQDHSDVDMHLKQRITVGAGPHNLGVTFIKQPSSLLETKRQPYQAQFNMHRHPRTTPAVYQVSITGPHGSARAGDTPSRRRIFVSRPAGPVDELESARQIVAHLARTAYRRPVDDDDLAEPLRLFRQGRQEGGFDAGIEQALSAILVSPHFVFRIEREPPRIEPGAVYRISDLELASRLSFLIWSSIPDDELLDLAKHGKLTRPDVLDRQVRRMLADRRSRALVTNFAAQWLHLRNLESSAPDQRLFTDFDDNLRQAFRQETELFLESILREDRGVLDLVRADYTYLNERLAKHYGIPHIYGSRFRRVSLDAASHRGGLLRHGSILTVTSYATRTSPVIRGKWVLENLMGTPPPPPPDKVPPLKDNTVAANLSVRERLAEHRSNRACSRCHSLIDPVGFALEHFDAVGRWREVEADRPIDATGGLPDGSTFEGVAGLEQALLRRPELLVRTVAEKLLTFALGRGVEYHDAPAVRKIVRQAQADEFRFSALVLGVVNSVPFQMRRAERPAESP